MSRPEAEQEESPEVVVRDRRKVDPAAGQTRAPEAEDDAASGADPGEVQIDEAALDAEDDAELDELTRLRTELEERTGDLQRVSAEYANYRRRTDRDRQLAATEAQSKVVTALLPVLDDIGRAEQHGDLTGAFKAVADKLVESLSGQGLEPFGAQGDPFDPNVHEAVAHATSAEVSGPTVTTVLRCGYRLGDRVLRPAMVEVADTADEQPGPDAAGTVESEPEASEPAQY